MPEIDNDAKIKVVRQTLMDESYILYHKLIEFLKSLPINQNHPLMTQTYIHIDNGMLWLKEAVTCLPIKANENVKSD